MKPLDRKLLRDLWRLRGQMGAIAVVVACGVATVVTTRTAATSLITSRAAYYADCAFADVFARLVRAPEAVAAELAAIPGVDAVETRVVRDVVVDVPGLDEPATGRLVSLPDNADARLNLPWVRAGRRPAAGRPDEAMVSEAFAGANRLTPGDTLSLLLNGRRQRVAITGIAISPEYVYEIGEASLFPDNRRFGVMWLGRAALAAAFDMTGAFDDVAMRLAPGAAEADVIRRADAVLARYGGTGAYGRRDQMSARFLDDEIRQNSVSGTVVPAIFLGIAAFLLNVVLSRLVGMQREQIAVLKAFGYSDAAVGWHFLALALVAFLAGAVAGIGLGIWFSVGVNAMYAEYYRFPAFLLRIDAPALGIALAVTLAAAALGALGAVRRVVRLPPAEAMLPESPARFRAGPLERLGVHRLLAPAGRIAARNLERRPVRAALTALSIALAAAMLVVGRFFVDAIVAIAEVQFQEVQREDATVMFAKPRHDRALRELAHLPGVLAVEGTRLAPARLVAGHRSRRVVITGLESRGELRRLVDRQRRATPLPPEGLVLTAKLAEILAVRAGDTVRVEVLEGVRAVRDVAVAGTVDELIGLSAYMDGAALGRMLGEGPVVSGAYLRTDPRRAEELYSRLKRLPGVAGVSSRIAALDSFRATLARSIGVMTAILVGFAGALAVAMVYNAARIALSERARELASLRVLGYGRGDVARMLLGEQAVLLAIGVAAGLAFGYACCAILAGLYQWEVFRLPLVVSGRTLVFAAGVTVAAGVLSGLVVRHRLDRLDLVAALKTRE